MTFTCATEVTDSFWERTDVDHVWFNSLTREYMFSDEAEQFNGPFLSKEEAKAELDYYVKTYL